MRRGVTGLGSRRGGDPSTGSNGALCRGCTRGITLVEVMVAVAVLSMISMIIFGAFSGMKNSKEGVQRLTDRYREGRLAMARIVRELQSAYLSLHTPIDPQLTVSQTVFVANPGSPADRLDFTSFAYRRLDRDAHESDQAEISYLGSEDPKQQGVIDLVRRVQAPIDIEPQTGGRVEVLATDIDLFKLEYLDPLTSEWVERWDTTQATMQPARLPLQVRVLLVLNGGARKSAGRSREPIRLTTTVALPIQQPLRFATQ
ncbi:MAG: prepilin-type N-terminal cleavage/methylation domain-containing protein [Polyangiaceae bacterium]|nr:prepilin-type N-terminal cleavage/methylation domain-containing protein [Polyangiaceae bacterium]